MTKSLTKNWSTILLCFFFCFEFESKLGIFLYESSSIWLSDSDSKLIAFSFWYGARKRSLSSINECINIFSFLWVLANSTTSNSLANVSSPFLKQKISGMNVSWILSSFSANELERKEKIVCEIIDWIVISVSKLHRVCCFLN